jgi:hypothetical protein
MSRAIRYIAEPTAADFHSSDKVARCFMGPVGNGKSVTCITELLRLAQDQWPNSEGVRKTRFAIIRNTNPELRSTTLNTWKQWIPPEICPITMHPIIMAKMDQPLSDGTRMQMECYFLALDRDEDVRKLLSLEITAAFINESREISFAVVKAARERIGRYPAAVDGYQDVYDSQGNLTYKAPDQPCKRKALLMDTNPPDDDHWWYQLAEEGCLRSTPEHQKEFAKSETSRIFDFFRGPSPLIKQSNGSYEPNPLAENIDHLPGGYQYYLDMIAGNEEDHVNVMVLGNYGHIKSGKPVYPEYSDQVHCPESGIIPIKGVPIALGWDFGLTPSCVVGQLTSLGQMIIHAELFSEDMGVRQFARDVVKPFLHRNFKGYEIEFSLGDPAGNNRGEGEGKSAIGILNDDYVNEFNDEPLKMGFITEPAPTNDPTLRLNAVKYFLTKLVYGGYPGYVLNKDCRLLRKGKNGGYRYKKIQTAGTEDRYNLKPDKNVYSHPADAEQYLALGYTYGLHVHEEDDHRDDYKETGIGGY